MGKIGNKKFKGIYKPLQLVFLILFIFIAVNAVAVLIWFIGNQVLGFVGINISISWILKWANIIALVISLWFTVKNLWKYNFRNKKEKMTSSDWMPKEEQKKKFKEFNFGQKKHDNGFLVQTKLINNNRDLKFRLANPDGHALIIGTTGSGKTALLVNPQIWSLATSKNPASLIITDPKGELYDSHHKFLQKQGYEVVTLNLRNEKNSHTWNPLDKIWELWKDDKEKAASYLNEFSSSLLPEGKGQDKFWNDAAKDIFQFMVLAYLELSDKNETLFPKEKFNITTIRGNIHTNSLTNLQAIKKQLPKNSYAVLAGGKHIDSNSEQTVDSILQTAVSNLSVYNDAVVKQITKETNMQINPQKPQAFFIIVPDETKAKYPFISLFVAQTYKELIDKAYQFPKLKLPRPFYFILDEFGNTPKINNMDSALTVARSRNIFFMLFLQNYAQLEEKYGKSTATTLIANCAFEYFLLTNDYETARKFSNKLGDKTLKVTANYNVKGESSDQERVRKIILPDELMGMKFGEMIIKIQREMPIKNHMAMFFNFSQFQKSKNERLENRDLEKDDLQLENFEFENDEKEQAFLNEIHSLETEDQNAEGHDYLINKYFLNIHDACEEMKIQKEQLEIFLEEFKNGYLDDRNIEFNPLQPKK